MNLLFSPLAIVVIVLVTAYAALLSQIAVAVFHDGVRPFLLDFHRGELSRTQMAEIAFRLSASFIFGFGLPLAFLSSVLNPWILFLPTDILGLLAPNKWLALLLGALWGAIVVFGLSAATSLVNTLPVNFLLPMQQMAAPIVFLFAFFPVIAIATQFGRLQGVFAFVVSLLAMLGTMKWWSLVFAPVITLLVGMTMLSICTAIGEINLRKAARQEVKGPSTIDSLKANKAEAWQELAEAAATREEISDEDETIALFIANHRRIRKHTLYFILMGVLIGILANTHALGGGEATGFMLARGQYLNATVFDFMRALGFIPLVMTTSVASGAFQVVGLMLIYSVSYLLPSPLFAGIVGGALFGLEIVPLISIGRGLRKLHVVREASDNIRYAINLTLEIALLFGSITAGNAMAGGVGIALVGGTYLLNEVLGRPIVRMSAGLVGVIVAGILLNVCLYLHLFTPK